MFRFLRLLAAMLLLAFLAACGGGGGGDTPSGDVRVSLSYSPPSGTVGVAYSYSPYYYSSQSISENFAISSGSLPPGLGISAGDGVISGTPTSSGYYCFNVTLTAKNVSGSVSSYACITVHSNSSSSSSAASSSVSVTLSYVPPAGGVGQAYSYTPTFSSTPTISPTFTATGLPVGLSINASTGAITGTPGVAGTYYPTIIMTARDLSSPVYRYPTITINASSGSSSSSVAWSSASSSAASSSASTASSSASSASSSAGLVSVGTGTAACTATSAVPVSAQASGAKLDLSLTHAALVYDKGRNVFYASIPSSVVGMGNRIATIDAASGVVSYSAAAVGSDPGALAISADCSTLYVGLNGSGELLRLALPSMKEDGRASLTVDSFFGKTRAETISVSPASADVVAVSQAYSGLSPRHAGVALFRSMVKQAKQTQTHTGSNVIGFDNTGAWVFGYNNETTEFGLRSISVLADGLSQSSVVATNAGFSAAIDVSAGLIMVGNQAYSTALNALGVVSGGYGCRRLPEIAKVVCATSTTGTLIVADISAFTVLATPSSGTDASFTEVLPGPKGLVVQRSSTALRLFRSDTFK